MTDLDKILNDLKSATSTEKVAEDQNPEDEKETKSSDEPKKSDSDEGSEGKSDSEKSLKKSIENLKNQDKGEDEPESEKEASVMNGLTKIAQEIAESDHEHLTKLGEVYGAAACDGFMARYAEYEEAGFGGGSSEKVAFEKNAEEEKIAFAQGYHDTMTVLQEAMGQQAAPAEKTAATEKTAEEVFIKEAQDGYAVGTGFFQKLAQDTYNRGYHDCEVMIGALQDS